MIKKYKKTMTRDNGLVLQEIWSYAFEEGFKKTSGLDNPYAPSLIYHVLDGANEIWEQDRAFFWFKDSLLNLNKESSEFFDKCLKEYRALLEEMEKYRETLDLKRLKELVVYMRDASRLFVILYYTAYDKRNPVNIRSKALAWREHDELYDIYEQIIKKSIANIAPWAKDLELVVCINELDNIPSKDILEVRMKESIFIPGKPIEIISIEDFSLKYKDYEFDTEKPTKEALEGVLKGQVASSGGVVKGRVRILRRKSEIEKIEEGEVLVSPMTTPDFVSAMKKSSVIVTDEGGITCHAAIVSRELKKPCLIGTKFATKVLKNGDLVEVDTNNGAVRVLERK